jgi:hypothetical protein
MAGGMGVDMAAAEIVAGEHLHITSERGDIVDNQMATDMHHTQINKDTAIGKSVAARTFAPAFPKLVFVSN